MRGKSASMIAVKSSAWFQAAWQNCPVADRDPMMQEIEPEVTISDESYLHWNLQHWRAYTRRHLSFVIVVYQVYKSIIPSQRARYMYSDSGQADRSQGVKRCHLQPRAGKPRGHG